MSKKTLVIVDSDGLAYHSLRETLEESLVVLDEKIQNIFEKTQCTHYCLFISKGQYFRHKLSDNTYKANRNKYQRQSWVKTLKAVLEEKYGATYMPNVESDDLCCYWYNQDLCIADDGKIEPRVVYEWTLESVRNSPLYTKDQEFTFESMTKILVSADKDLLQGIAGKHFDYTYRLEEKGNPDSVIKGNWVETLPADADNFLKMQMIVGDTADGIKGLPGKGIRYWEQSLENEDCDHWFDFLGHYIRHYNHIPTAIYEFQKNFRQLYILQTDEDFLREVQQLPELPEIREVIRDSQIENLEINEEF